MARLPGEPVIGRIDQFVDELHADLLVFGFDGVQDRGDVLRRLDACSEAAFVLAAGPEYGLLVPLVGPVVELAGAAWERGGRAAEDVASLHDVDPVVELGVVAGELGCRGPEEVLPLHDVEAIVERDSPAGESGRRVKEYLPPSRA